MSFSRIKFNLATGATTGSFEVPINPEGFRQNRGTKFQPHVALDGETKSFLQFFDGDEKTLHWRSLPLKRKFIHMVEFMKSLKGKKVYVLVGPIDVKYGTIWEYIKVTDYTQESVVTDGVERIDFDLHFRKVYQG